MKKIYYLLTIVALSSFGLCVYAMEESIICKKSKSEQDNRASVVTIPTKSLKNICLAKVAQHIKHQVDPMNPFENLAAIKNILESIPDLKEKLLEYLHADTQPVWEKGARVFKEEFDLDEVKRSDFGKTTLAWLDGEQDNHLRYIDTAKSQVSHLQEIPNLTQVVSLRITPDEKYIAAISNVTLFLFDTSGAPCQSIVPGYIFASAVAADGTVVLGTSEGTCHFVKKNDNYLAVSDQSRFFSQPVCALEYSCDGSMLLASDGGNIAISHKAADFKDTHVLTIPEWSSLIAESCVKSLLLSPDSTILVINFTDRCSLAYSFIYDCCVELPDTIIKIDHANRCISTKWTQDLGDDDDSENNRMCQLDYNVVNFIDKSCTCSTYLLPKDSSCLVKYQSDVSVNPLSAVFKQRDEGYPYVLVQKKVNLKELLYLIAINKASYEELQALQSYPILKSFKEKCCGNVVKHFVNYRLEQLKKKGF
jgi:hypothetical protein